MIYKADDKLLPGAHYRGGGICDFHVWAPLRKAMSVAFPESGRKLSMEKGPGEYWTLSAGDVAPGALYQYGLDDAGLKRPDPASRFQPEGVHGPSAVVDPSAFAWSDSAWRGIPLEDLIIYELHVGTATEEGTFSSVIRKLDYLLELGVNTLELMPVAQFAGRRNWGYDGVYPYAPQNSYGGPEGLKALVNACHARGMAVMLDVVYNHLGPEGNYLEEFGPYFTGRYRTPWGAAVNFDGPWSDSVRHYFVSNAVYWVTDYHLDGLRIDAIHGIFDFSARHILEEMAEAVHSRAGTLGRKIHVMAESDLNDARVISAKECGGYGLDALWNDDFHHCLHVLLTGERDGYYRDFDSVGQLEKACTEGFVYSGQYSAYRNRRHGNSSRGLPASRFVVFSQNHDQTGNRALGDRLCSVVSFEKLKLAAAAVILAPYLPLLFMGEEYGETAPFQYFISHTDPELVEAVRKGRREEFASFGWIGNVPDPQDEATFHRSRLTPGLHNAGNHAKLYAFYRELISLRKRSPSLSSLNRETCETGSREDERLLSILRWSGEDMTFSVFNFDEQPQEYRVRLSAGRWDLALDSASEAWGGPGGAAFTFFDSTDMPATLKLAPVNALVYKKRRDC